MYTPQYAKQTKGANHQPLNIFLMNLRDDYVVVVQDDGAINLIKAMERVDEMGNIENSHHIEASKNIDAPLESANTIEDREGFIRVITKAGDAHDMDMHAWLERHEANLAISFDSTNSEDMPQEKPRCPTPKMGGKIC